VKLAREVVLSLGLEPMGNGFESPSRALLFFYIQECWWTVREPIFPRKIMTVFFIEKLRHPYKKSSEYGIKKRNRSDGNA